MTVHFAPARSPDRSPVARVLRRAPIVSVANDDGDGGHDAEILRAALEHFAQCGLGAAGSAAAFAVRDHALGDAAGHHRWLAICRTFDRRLAAKTARELLPVRA